MDSAAFFSEADIAFIVKQVCQGVEYIASQRVVHLDLKPENIVCINPEVKDEKILPCQTKIILQNLLPRAFTSR